MLLNIDNIDKRCEDTMFKDRIDRILLRGTLLLIVLGGPASIVFTVVDFFRDRSLAWTSRTEGYDMLLPRFLGNPLPGTAARAEGDL